MSSYLESFESVFELTKAKIGTIPAAICYCLLNTSYGLALILFDVLGSCVLSM